MEKIEKLPLRDFTRFCMSIAQVPSSYLSGLTMEEQILWLCSFLTKEVIPTVNNNGKAVEELQNLYILLRDYVDHYFDNLDIQEEVNTKLEEMAQSGELAELISQYLNSQAVIGFNNNADLSNAVNLGSGSFVKTFGKITYNDGQGALYKVRTRTNQDVPDGDKLIALSNTENLVAEMIPYSRNYNMSKDIEEMSRNSKYIAYIYCDNAWRQSLEYVRNALKLFVEAGYKETQMLININNNGTIIEDKTKFTDYNNIANELNIPITSVKFHGNYTSSNYLNVILNCLQYFPNATTCFIFNEQLEDVATYGTTYPATIKLNYPNITKVGFTAAYNKCFYGNEMTNAMWNGLLQNFDVMGVHMYPGCATFDNPSLCSYEKVLNSFNNPQFNCPWNKEIWITESGVLPYWQFMEDPENYETSKLTDTTFNVEPQRIFFRALANCNMAQKAVKVIPFFLESGITDENHTLFKDILKNIIRGV